MTGPHLRIALRALAVATTVGGLVSCDTGDGTTLQTPAPGATAPPTTTTDTTDPSGTLASVPITTPAGAPGDDAGASGATIAVPEVGASGELVVSTPWADGRPMGRRFTCAGRDVAPPVSWQGVPPGTAAIAISLVDETTAGRGDRGFVHWVIAGLDPARLSLAAGEVPAGAVQALNFFGDVGYGGPCPPRDEIHEYRLTVHALASPIDLPAGTPALQFLDAIDAASIDEVSVVGTFRGR